MTTILQNSIWPNTDGNLGNIKVQIEYVYCRG